MPAARRQSAEQGRFRRLAIEVKRLPVKLSSKFPDLRLIQRVRSARKTLAHVEIVKNEGMRHGTASFGHRGSPRKSNLHYDSNCRMRC